MAGIYIHIPFCKQACHYCDFHFSTTLKSRGEMLEAIKKEISLQKLYLEDEKLETIYFGGGTPSILQAEEIMELLNIIRVNFRMTEKPEISLEANPDDLSMDKLQGFRSAGVNRLSIGIQSFYEEDLLYMNRVHSDEQAISSVKNSIAAGFENISIDLIYGTPTLTQEEWKKNLDIAFSLGVQHLSCYSLTVEPRTALAAMINAKKVSGPEDERTIKQFETLIERSNKEGFEHYEISNFALPGFHSQHNSSYWEGKPYLGIGPSAHSFNRLSRQWNISNNQVYIKRLAKGEVPAETEILTEKNKYNEFILIRLRTSRGIDIEILRQLFQEAFVASFISIATIQEEKGLLKMEENYYRLTNKGKLYADRIASDFFLID